MLMAMIFGYMAGLTAYILGVIILAFEPPADVGRDPEEDYSFLDTIIDVEWYIVSIGHFLPTFNLALALNRIQNRQLISILSRMGQEVLPAWDPKIAKTEIYWLIYTIPGYFALVLLIQFVTDSPQFLGLLMNFFQRNINSYTEITDRDDDVEEEDRKVRQAKRQALRHKFSGNNVSCLTPNPTPIAVLSICERRGSLQLPTDPRERSQETVRLTQQVLP